MEFQIVVSFYIGGIKLSYERLQTSEYPSSIPLAIKKGRRDFSAPGLESCICYGPSNLLCKPCGSGEV